MSLDDKRDDFYNSLGPPDTSRSFQNKPNVEVLKAESITEIKRYTLNKLLAKIKRVDFYGVCKELGWKPTINTNGDENPPTQSNYKVAIIDELMKAAKSNNWHLALDSGLFYIYTGSMWISLDKDELKNFLKDVAIKQSYPPIKAKDSKFVIQLYDQAIQDGFFTDKYCTPQSMINLSNCTLVLKSSGVTIKDFDYRDFLTHQLPFNYEPKERNVIFQQYLDDVLPDKETQHTLQETCGYLFIKGLKLEKIFFLYGTGANGKSVLFEVINGLIGDENISHYSLESLTDGNGYFRAKIKDKIVNYGTDNVALFLDELIYESCEISICYLSDVYIEYKVYCLDNGYRTLGKNNFAKRLQALGIKRTKDNHNKDGFNMVKKYKR